MAGGAANYRHLSRKSSHRQALLRNLVTSLIKHESITTTWPKAKEAQRLAEKLITLGKKNTEQSRRSAISIFFVCLYFRQMEDSLANSLDPPLNRPQTLRSSSRTLRRQTRRLHTSAPRRAQKGRPSTQRHSGTRRRPQGHEIRHDGTNALPETRTRHFHPDRVGSVERAESNQVPGRR